MQKDDNIIDLYFNFITHIENKINPLSLIEIVAHVTHQYKDKKEAITFLEGMVPKVKNNHQAWTLCKVLQGQLYLDYLKDLESTSKIIDEVEETLEDVDGVTPVHVRYYKLASDYYRICGPLANYFRAGLRYVGSANGGKDLPTSVQHSMAVSLALAGAYAPDVFDLGELAIHPIMKNLEGTKDFWALELVRSVADGDSAVYYSVREHVPENILNDKIALEKISLLFIVKLAHFMDTRVITFDHIRRWTSSHHDRIELLIMKAMAKKLIKGSIDQVNQTVRITWAKPRVMSEIEMDDMNDRLDEWLYEVKRAADTLESQAGEVLTS